MFTGDFSTIRVHRTSQQEAFEELCCQLAFLETYPAGSRWIRKAGAGGDAGVEGYWQLPEGDEHCWQAKFFFQPGNAQWRQLDDSVRTALAKHPACSRYVICLPINLSDSRPKRGRSQRDRWNDRVVKWQKWAGYRSIEFVLWDAHALTDRLSRPEPQYGGRCLYWFGQQLLIPAWFRDRYKEARANLGERYTPELHVDLPIARRFEGLARSPAFRERLGRWPRLPSRLGRGGAIADQVEGIIDRLTAIRDAVRDRVERWPFPLDLSRQRSELRALEEVVGRLLPRSRGKDSSDALTKEQERALFDLSVAISEHRSHLDSPEVETAEHGALLLVGQAGTGKSHLLADVAQRATDAGQPAVLLLGAHFAAGDPLSQLCQGLGYQGDTDAFLGALDAAGQAAGVRALLLIDALNESRDRWLWKEHLAGLVAKLNRFPYIAFVASCRTTYERRIITASAGNALLRVEHQGFLGYEERAARVYLDRQGIDRPSAPTLAPELSNPLFLKTLCAALIRKGLKAVPKGLRGISRIFEFYLASLEATVTDRLGLDPHQSVVRRFLETVRQAMADRGTSTLAKAEVVAIMERIAPSGGLEERSLLAELLSEGALSEDVEYRVAGDDAGEDVVRFTFERFLDHFRARDFLDRHLDSNDPGSAFASSGPFRDIIGDRPYMAEGFIEALSVQVPERCGRELMGLAACELNEYELQQTLKDGFRESLIWRDPEATNEETVEWINALHEGIGDPELLRTVLRIATEPRHVLNAERLYKSLLRFKLPDRDAFWSTWIAREWEDDPEEPVGPLEVLVNWAWHGNTAQADPERVRLAGIALSWMLSTPRRSTRDKATKALVSLLTDRVDLVRELLLRFDRVDDPYIRERLYAVAYGVAMRFSDPAVITRLARTVLNRVFRRKPHVPPHILLRDYARGIVEKAAAMNQLPGGSTVDEARPPYRSAWPLDDPGVAAVEAIEEELPLVRHSVMVGDFGTYVMNDVFSFSATERTAGPPKTWAELTDEFGAELAARPDIVDAWRAFTDAQACLKAIENDRLIALDRAHAASSAVDRFLAFVDEVEHGPVDGNDVGRQEAKAALESAHADLKARLTPDEQDKLRWMLGGGRGGNIAPISRRFAKRWVINRVKELGWTKERFEEFERSFTGTRSRMEHNRERIGKKYQWIAYHELLAHLADHLHYIEHWSDGARPYEGPWQLGRRDVDPSYLRTESTEAESSTTVAWWVPHFRLDERLTVTEAHSWVRDPADLPEAQAVSFLREPGTGRGWLLLSLFSRVSERHESNLDPWRTINLWVQALITPASRLPGIAASWSGKNLLGDLGPGRDTAWQAFLSEYPWHPVWGDEQVVREQLHQINGHIPDLNAHLPVRSYSWGASGYDRSIENNAEVLLPSPFLCKQLGLTMNRATSGFEDATGQLRFFDPKRASNDPSAALIEPGLLLRWLRDNEFAIIWKIVTTKQYIERGDKFAGELIDCQQVHYDGASFGGERWTLLVDRGSAQSILRSPEPVATDRLDGMSEVTPSC